jgi:hypothetical protein
MFPNNEIDTYVFIYDTVAVNLGSFFALTVKIGIIQKRIIFFRCQFQNVFFELIVNYKRVRKKMFFCSKWIF